MLFLAQQSQLPDDIADIALPVEIPIEPGFPWLWIILAGLFFVALGVLIYFLRRKIKPQPEIASPRERVLQELDEAAAQHLESEDSYAFSIRLADVLRDYVAGQFGIAMHRQTSPEFLERLRYDPQFSEDSKEVLRVFLERSDAFKFAHIPGSREDNQWLLEKAQEFVNHTDPAWKSPEAPEQTADSPAPPSPPQPPSTTSKPASLSADA